MTKAGNGEGDAVDVVEELELLDAIVVTVPVLAAPEFGLDAEFDTGETLDRGGGFIEEKLCIVESAP